MATAQHGAAPQTSKSGASSRGLRSGCHAACLNRQSTKHSTREALPAPSTATCCPSTVTLTAPPACGSGYYHSCPPPARHPPCSTAPPQEGPPPAGAGRQTGRCCHCMQRPAQAARGRRQGSAHGGRARRGLREARASTRGGRGGRGGGLRTCVRQLAAASSGMPHARTPASERARSRSGCVVHSPMWPAMFTVRV